MKIKGKRYANANDYDFVEVIYENGGRAYMYKDGEVLFRIWGSDNRYYDADYRRSDLPDSGVTVTGWYADPRSNCKYVGPFPSRVAALAASKVLQ
ncbi:hypothetical protein [Paraburkholderia unamae]|uniref:Uncharacterized protein n=1 Tax=Paraburkholderia unamae TaxID=219649 RepID=A0ACC6RH78_9BURK